MQVKTSGHEYLNLFGFIIPNLSKSKYFLLTLDVHILPVISTLFKLNRMCSSIAEITGHVNVNIVVLMVPTFDD